MVRSATTAALFGALVAAPLHDLHAQPATDFVLKPSPEKAENARLAGPRLNQPRKRQRSFEETPELFGIPLTQDRAAARERGLFFGARPDKGVRATAKLRF
jgi:hypothetical protein